MSQLTQNPSAPSAESPDELILASTERHGPLPPPRDFAAYNRVLSSAADRILTMAEQEQRMTLKLRWADWVAQYTALIMGRLFLYLLVLSAVYLVLQDKPVEALFAGLAPIVAAIYSTVIATRDTTSDEKDSHETDR